MATVASFVVIEGDTSVPLGDSAPTYTKLFSTPNYNGGEAVMTFMVTGLTAATSPAPVEINGKFVGNVFPHRYAAVSDQIEVSEHFYAASLNVGLGVLSAVSPNTLKITAVGFPESTPDNELDDFAVRAISLFYHVTV